MSEPATNEQLRSTRGLRALETAEEGTAAGHIANGVYGFTYSPAEAMPLFTKKTWHSFEVHKLADGTEHLVGFVTGKDAEIVRNGAQAEIILFPDPWEDATELISVPLTHAIPSKKGPSREGGNGLKLALV